jgi:transcriptional regulator with XRE-family HTH domain
MNQPRRYRSSQLKSVECHPAQHHSIQFFFEQLAAQGITQKAVARKTGLHYVQINKWARKHTPSVANIEAALNAIGFKLEVVPIKSDEAACLADYYLVEY